LSIKKEKTLEMDYIEIKLTFSEINPWKDVFITLLSEEGCDSFMDGEDDNLLFAYILQEKFDEKKILNVVYHHGFNVKCSVSFSKIETQDWNALWESNYAPVLIGNQCFIHAPFHEPMDDIAYNIVIEPKMSFGTAHHETTSLMIEYLLEEDLQEKSLLDMGSGTGILAILAYKKGAMPITAIDNDDWAYRNNLENNERNHAANVQVIHGDARHIPNIQYNIILANINRNILLDDIPSYAVALQKNGVLLLSGFYKEPDLELIKEKCLQYSLHCVNYKEKNNWVAAKFEKR
jgi:ribosomal protein L11 methyltransferase